VRLRRAVDGEYRWFLVRIAPLCDKRGNIVKWHGVLTDIEDRKRAEQALKRSEAYLAEAQELTKQAAGRGIHIRTGWSIARMKSTESSGSIRPKESPVLKHLYNGYTPMIAPWLEPKAYRPLAKGPSMHLNTESCWPTARQACPDSTTDGTQ